MGKRVKNSISLDFRGNLLSFFWVFKPQSCKYFCALKSVGDVMKFGKLRIEVESDVSEKDYFDLMHSALNEDL